VKHTSHGSQWGTESRSRDRVEEILVSGWWNLRALERDLSERTTTRDAARMRAENFLVCIEEAMGLADGMTPGIDGRESRIDALDQAYRAFIECTRPTAWDRVLSSDHHG
jgi:hypothetical protein